MLLIINAVSTGSKYFQVLGDVTDQVAAGDYLQVLKSTGNNGVYEIASVAYASGYSRLTTVEAIPSNVADGVISLGVYDLKFSQSDLPGKESIVITPYGIDTTTSLRFNGAATLNYGEYQQENLLHLLENFASANAPANPTAGQHWYDSTNVVVKTYTGVEWSTDVNIEDGVISFKDPQHPTPGTKYFITANEASGLEGSGVSIYPAANPAPGSGMFRVVDADGVEALVVEYSGAITTTNTLSVLSANGSSFNGALSVNTGAGAATGLTVNGSIAITNGDVVVDTNAALRVAGGASVTVSSAVTLRGSAPAAGTIIQTTGGADIVTFGDSSTVFSRPVSFTSTLAASSINVSGTATIATADITTGTVDALTATNATIADATITSITGTTLTMSGTSTFEGPVIVELTPTMPLHAANKAYVDNVSTELSEQTQHQLIAIWTGI